MADPGRWRVRFNDAYLAAQWTQLVAPIVFSGAISDPRPTLALLGGQPAAGKSRGGDLILNQLVTHPYMARVVIDDLRQFHPQYRALLRDDPLAMPDVTAPAAGAWTRMAIAHAFDQKYPILVEGTWRDPNVPAATIAEARAAGFRVHAVVLAVNPVVSRLSTLERYYRDVDAGKQARWTPLTVHDEAATKLVDTVRQLGASADVDQVTTIDRDGTVLFDAGPAVGTDLAARGDAWADALTTAMTEPLSTGEATRWLHLADELHQLHQAHTIDTPAAVGVWKRITTTDRPLVQLILETPTPATNADALLQRATALRERSSQAAQQPREAAPTRVQPVTETEPPSCRDLEH